ncbi:MAG: CHAT domain-containing protein, partial [candidate division KSB1 bacterium]|nr:CHAT domain-containing protein [candidate division KSB1 bacterium]
AIADSCYRSALAIATGENLPADQIFAHQNLGQVSFVLGDYEDAKAQYAAARTLAIRYNLFTWLWRIDFALGSLLSHQRSVGSDADSSKDASYFFEEAINSLEQTELRSSVLRTTPTYRHQVRQVYQTVIDYWIAQGKLTAALRLTERLRDKQYLDFISGQKLELKKERHKIILGNARFLNQKINELNARIWLAREKADRPEAEITAWRGEKRGLEDELRKLLEEIRRDDPQLEAFIRVEPISLQRVQEILTPQSMILNYFLSDRQMYLWAITRDSVRFVTLPVKRDSLEQQVRQLVSDIRGQRDYQPSLQWLWQRLFAPLGQELASYRQICIIPDGVLAALPFSFLIHANQTEPESLHLVTTAASMASYFFSFQQRKIRGSRVYWASALQNPALEDLGYAVEAADFTASPNRQSLAQLRQASQSADVVYWNLTFNPNDHDPLIARISLGAIPRAISFQLRDLYSFDLNASLLLIDGLSEFTTSSFQVFERGLVYAGVPGILVSLWPTTNHALWNRFLALLQDYPAAEALARAQLEMKRANLPAAAYAGYQLIGFQGMDDEQEFIFARERFAQRVAIGNQYAREGAWADALTNYELALAMAKKQGQTDAIQNLQLLIIDSATNGGLYDKAISYQLDMIEAARADQDAQALLSGYFNLVDLNLKNKNYEQAIKFQFEFIALAQEQGLQDETAGGYRSLGVIHEQMGDYEKALQYYSQAIKTFEEYHIPLGVAYALKDRGKLYLLKLDNYSRAIEDQEQALTIFQAHQDSLNIIEVLQNLGLSHERLANYQTAWQYQLEALALAEKLNLPDWLALAYQYLANVSWKMGHYERALKYQKQALAIYDQLGNRHFQSIGYATMGLIFMSLGNLDEALKYESQALELAQTSGSQQDLAAILKNMGLIYRGQNRWSEALNYFQRATRIDEALGSQSGLSYGYRDIGSIYFQQGKIDSALIYFRRALSISQEIRDGRNAVQCLYEIGKTYLQLNQTAAALDTLTRAANLSEQLFIPEVEWRCRRLIGKLLWQQNRLPQSLDAYQKALSIIETMRAQIKVEEYKSGFIDDKLDVYHDVVDIHLQLNQPGQALEMVERAKSRNFIDLLANRDIQFGGRSDAQQLAQGKLLENELRRVQNDISRLLMKGDRITVPEREELAGLMQQLQLLKERYQQFLILLKEQNAELASMIQVEPPNIEQVQAALPDSVAIIEYFYTSDRFYVWTITNRRVSGRSQPYRSVDLVAQVTAFREALQKQTSVINISQRLHDLLLTPIAADLASANHLVIVPHGILHYLPFAALMDNTQRYLIERYSLSLAPSASVLQLCLNKGQAFLSESNWPAEILALGNPDLQNPALELPFAEKEIESIRLLYPRVVSYVDRQATESVFKASCASARMILLSCHGEFDAANPLFSALLLTADKENDGRLEAHEIFDLQMNAYLVVMSACETGLAKVAVGDELIGLSRSFIYAGSASLLSSLWKVDDLATAVMIKRFFRYLKEGQPRARALQQAINFVREQINVHPVYWAAFNLTGDFR